MSRSTHLKVLITLIYLILSSCKKNPSTKIPVSSTNKEDIQKENEDLDIENEQQEPTLTEKKETSDEGSSFEIPLIDSYYAHNQQESIYDLTPEKLIPSDYENLYITGIRRQRNLTKPMEELFLIKYNMHSGWDSNGIFVPSIVESPPKDNDPLTANLEILGGMKYKSGKILILTNQKTTSTKTNPEKKVMKTFIFGANDSGLLRTRHYKETQEIFLTAASSSKNQEFMILGGKSNSKNLNSVLGLMDEDGNFLSYFECPEKSENIALIHSISNDHFVVVVEYEKTWLLRSYRIHSISKEIVPISELEIMTPIHSHIAQVKPSSIDHHKNTLAVSMEIYGSKNLAEPPSLYLFQTEIYPNGLLSQSFKQVFQDSWSTHPKTSFISIQSEKISLHRSRENYSSLGHMVQESSVFFSTKDISSSYSGFLWELFRFEDQNTSTNIKEEFTSHKRILKSVHWPGEGPHEKYLWFLSEHRFFSKNLDNPHQRSWIHLGSYAIP